MSFPPISVLPQTSIRYRCWEVPKPKAILLLVHGLGAHSGRWEFLAEYFQRQGIASWAIELQGFGDTPGPRGHIASFHCYYRDILALHNHIRGQFPKAKLFILGESLGGLMVFRMAQLFPDLKNGIILISPAFQNAMAFKLTDYLILLPALLFRPQTSLNVPFTAAMCTRDEAYQAVMQANPLELRTASARLLFLTLLEQLASYKHLAKINLPTLFLMAGQDLLVNPKGGEKIFNQLRLNDKQLIAYPEMRHALSIDKDREHVFADIFKWLKGKIG